MTLVIAVKKSLKNLIKTWFISDTDLFIAEIDIMRSFKEFLITEIILTINYCEGQTGDPSDAMYLKMRFEKIL